MSSRSAAKLALVSIGAVSVALSLINNVASLQLISGRSMQPALNPDSNHLWRDALLMDMSVRRGRNPQRLRRGDIVTFTSPSDPDKRLVKRVLALPHDCVVPAGSPDSFVRVPMGQCWVEGDESFHSGDSNTFGPVPLALLHGRALMPVWPPSRFAASMGGVPEWKKKRVYVNGSSRLDSA
ncbi:hypothetical protein GGI07_000055 [Coemansia sp. Benny D115]|nr:hypothetical protein GGI07_000055 [Coemansia sp. Benny D115]